MRVFTSLLLLTLAVPAAAQEQEIRSANLPPDVEWRLIRMFDGGAERMNGPATVEPDRAIQGDLAVYGGPLRLAGRVEGDVVMVDGDVILERASAVTGSITVVGGEVRMEGEAEVAGTITAYALGRARVRSERDRERDRDEDRWWRPDRRRHWGDDGYARLDLRLGSGYNRVEGLPVLFGPTLRTAGPNPLQLHALAIWRSEAGASLETDRMGYEVAAEQFFGGHRAFSIGGSLFSVIEPLEDWHISHTEASLAAVLFHDDYRDYYDRTGWSVFARAEPVSWLEARLEYRDEQHDAIPAGDPWSLFDGGDRWRLQPLVGEGGLETVRGSLELDFRDHEEDPYRGWFLRAGVTRAVGGDLTRPLLFGDHPDVWLASYQLPAEAFDTDFATGHLDLRHYAPVSRGSQLNLRLAAGGALTERRLPAQYQHALGGIGTLPGFSTFHADCGARALVGRRGTSQYYPAYGCDRFALGQVEYRGDLSLYFGMGDPDDDDDWWDYVEIDFEPTWVVFFDAAQGWAYEDGLGADRDTGLLYDAGVGLLLDDLGFYMALPLNGDVEQEPRFFVRLGRRF
jgi:hypothetical protein